MKILGDGTHELTVMNRLQDELGVIVASFAPVGAMARRGAVGVATRAAFVVEEKTVHMLLLVLLLFLRLYYNHNRKT